LQLIPVSVQHPIGVEVWIIAHDVLIGTVQPSMIELIAQLHGIAVGGIAKGLHTTNVLIKTEGTICRAGRWQ